MADRRRKSELNQVAPSEQARLPGQSGPGAKQRRPFKGKLALHNVVPLRFERTFIGKLFNAGELFLSVGETVVVDTDKGPALATVTGLVRRQVVERGSVRRVIRRATPEDEARHEENKPIAREAFQFCLTRIRARNLKMKLCQVEYMLDRSRVLFYFSADHRIDFRQLVRDLARELDARIEMRQVGVRDGAGLIGGIGPCGKELCCSSFLMNFRSISIRHAKDQGLTLNPKKVSGMCGRLMCCLVYEHPTYRAAKKGAPRINRAVSTSEGAGVVTEVDLLRRRLRVLLETGTFEVFEFGDVVVDNNTIRRARDITITASRPKSDARVTRAGARLEEQYVWEGADADDHSDLEKQRGPKQESGKRRRRRRSRGRGGSGDGSRSKPANQSASKSDSPNSEAPQKGQGSGSTSGKNRTSGSGRSDGQSRRRRGGGGNRQPATTAQEVKAVGSDGSEQPQKKRRRRRRRRGRGAGAGNQGKGPGSGGDGGGNKSNSE